MKSDRAFGVDKARTAKAMEGDGPMLRSMPGWKIPDDLIADLDAGSVGCAATSPVRARRNERDGAGAPPPR